jgi:hypothetical protein
VKSKNGIILFAVNGLARSVEEQNAPIAAVRSADFQVGGLPAG